MNEIPVMDKELSNKIAQSLDATPALLPFIQELLADLWALGVEPDTVVELLRPLGLSSQSTRLLDMGCGKGAVAVFVAAELGYRAYGVDGFVPFIEEAERRAEVHGVAELCEFQCGDMRETARVARDYDVVVYAAHGPMFDDKPCVELLRRCVRPGGYIIVDDGYLAEGVRSVPAGYEDYLPHDETVARLTAYGDLLVREVVLSAEKNAVSDQRSTDLIRRRAEGLAARHSEAADMLLAYVQTQERECRILREAHVPAVWLLQRA